MAFSHFRTGRFFVDDPLFNIMPKRIAAGFSASSTDLWFGASGILPIVPERLPFCLLAFFADFRFCTGRFFPFMVAREKRSDDADSNNDAYSNKSDFLYWRLRLIGVVSRWFIWGLSGGIITKSLIYWGGGLQNLSHCLYHLFLEWVAELMALYPSNDRFRS